MSSRPVQGCAHSELIDYTRSCLASHTFFAVDVVPVASTFQQHPCSLPLCSIRVRLLQFSRSRKLAPQQSIFRLSKISAIHARFRETNDHISKITQGESSHVSYMTICIFVYICRPSEARRRVRMRKLKIDVISR